MKKIFLFFIFFFIFVQPALARSGCCSHHGGVRGDGCGCNDGSPLSDTCAPYYVCSAGGGGQVVSDPPATSVPAIVYPTNTPYPTKIWPTWTPKPTRKPTPTITLVPTLTSTPSPTMRVKRIIKKINSPTPTPQYNWWEWLFGR